MKRIKLGLALGLALLLVLLAGCQAVGGIDVSKAVVSTMDVKSSESKSSLSLELVPADGSLTAEDRKMIDLLNSLSVTIDSARTQDASNASLEGSVGLKGKQIPFHLAVEKESLALTLGGMTQPVVFPMKGMEGMDLSGLQVSNESALKMIKDVSGFLFKHAPNPSSISLTSVTDKVNGESLSLQKLHVDIHGDELAGLVKGFLTSVSKDKEGLKEILGAVYDVYYPIIASMTASMTVDTGEDMSAALGTTENVMKDKDAAITAMVDEVQKALDELLPNYDQTVKELYEETPELNVLLGKDTVLSLDFFLDSKLQIRKQNMDLTIQIPQVEGVPLKQVKVHSNAETWNINQPVTMNKVDTSKGVWDISQDSMTPGEMLRHLDSKSDLYRLLKEDAQITHKVITLPLHQDGTYFYYPESILVNNTMTVPVKYVAQELNAKTKYNDATKELTMVDDLTGSTIVVQIGSQQATVDGKKIKLDLPVTVSEINGSAYVPSNFIANVFGAHVNWDKSEGIVTIERD